MNLWIPKALVNGTYPTQVDWPIVTGQLIEFRLPSCNATHCKVYTIPSSPFYLKVPVKLSPIDIGVRAMRYLSHVTHGFHHLNRRGQDANDEERAVADLACSSGGTHA